MASGTSRPLLCALALCVAGAACAGAQPTAAAAVGAATRQATMQTEFGREFQLRNTEVATIGSDELTLRFNRVTSDERCSVGSRCESDGDAVVEVTLRQPPSDAATFHLHTDPSLQSEARYFRYSVRLVRLEPRPVGEQPVPLAQYIGTFVVSVVRAPKS